MLHLNNLIKFAIYVSSRWFQLSEFTVSSAVLLLKMGKVSANKLPPPHHISWVRLEQLDYFRSVLSLHVLSIISCRLAVIFIDVISLQEAVSMHTWNPFKAEECQHPPPPHTCILLMKVELTYLIHLRQVKSFLSIFSLCGLCRYTSVPLMLTNPNC